MGILELETCKLDFEFGLHRKRRGRKREEKRREEKREEKRREEKRREEKRRGQCLRLIMQRGGRGLK